MVGVFNVLLFSFCSQSSTSTASTSISEKLPEGFFDDAKMDAKVGDF